MEIRLHSLDYGFPKIFNFVFLLCFPLLLPLVLGFFPLISLELCLDANVDVFFSLLARSTVANSPYAFSDVLYFGILR